jgi:hypothetical protein
MAKTQEITKFAIGTFKNGAYSVFGILKNGILKGVVIKTRYPNVFRKFSFVKISEFQNKEDSFPRFIKKINFLTKTILYFKGNLYGNTNNAVDFMHEVCDLPSCTSRYLDFIELSKRNVLVEKYSRTNEIAKYVKLNAKQEFELIKIISEKYSKNDIVQVCVNEVPTAYKPRTGLWDNDIYCPVKLYSHHNENIYVIFRTYHTLSQIFNTYIFVIMRDDKVKYDIEKFIEKNV